MGFGHAEQVVAQASAPRGGRDLAPRPAERQAATRVVERQQTPSQRSSIAVDRTPRVAPPRDARRDYTLPSSVVSDYFNKPAQPILPPGLSGGTRRPADHARVTRERPATAETRQPRAEGGRHTITCSGCGEESVVPFEPDLSRPVYCSACFGKRRGNRRG